MSKHEMSYWSRVVTHSPWLVSLYKEETWTQREREPHGKMKTDGIVLIQAKEHATWPVNHWKLAEAWDMFSLSALGGNQPCPSLEFRLWASRTRREKSLWFKPPSLWDSVMEVLADPLHPWMALLSQFTALTTVNMYNKDLRNDLFYSRDMTPTPLTSIPAQISLDFPIGLLFPFLALREPWVLNETVTGEESRISASHLFGNVPCSVFSSQ